MAYRILLRMDWIRHYETTKSQIPYWFKIIEELIGNTHMSPLSERG